MKNLFIYLCCIIIFTQCNQQSKSTTIHLRDGFYQVNDKGVDSTKFGAIQPNEITIIYNSIYNDQEFTKLLIDTSDFVPLELEQLPVTKKDSLENMQLSITLSAEAAHKIKSFTAQRINKGLAIVLDGEAITMHKVRDTIQGGQMVISFCGENACRQLYTRIKDNVKK